MDLAAFQARFATDAACRAYLEEVRWPQGPVCPACGAVGHVSRIKTRPGLCTCLSCRKQFTVTVGTPMQGSHLPLTTWFLAMYLMATSSKGVSAMKLSQWLGIGYKTAWFLAHRVREMMKDRDANPLVGIVEVDETYVGGKKRKKRDDDEDRDGRPSHRGRGPARAAVLVAVERGSKVKAERIATHSVAEIAPRVREWLSRDATMLTDELPAYRWIGSKQVRHLKVLHRSDEFARTCERTGIRVHVNTAESWNNQLKRAIVGVWHKVSAKHVSRYAGEVAFRWNRRQSAFLPRLGEMMRAEGRLTFAALTERVAWPR
jgi:transposase-like protein